MVLTQLESNASDAARRRPRALVVDDDPTTRNVHRRLLTRCGFDADAVANGQDAIHAVLDSQAIREPFDIILMDSAVPVVDGWVASSTLRRNGYTGRLVVLSDGVDPSTRARCASCRVDVLLLRPSTAHVLMSAIKACVIIPNRRLRRSRVRPMPAQNRFACSP